MVATSELKPGDLVRFIGSGLSVLDGGPGRIVKVEGTHARVEVLHATRTTRPPAKPGEIYFFALERLERVGIVADCPCGWYERHDGAERAQAALEAHAAMCRVMITEPAPMVYWASWRRARGIREPTTPTFEVPA